VTLYPLPIKLKLIPFIDNENLLDAAFSDTMLKIV
jgi:hypothetical protein